MNKPINEITLSGKIVSDVSVRESKKGYSVADFRLMHKNQKARNPVFVDIEVWQEEAKRVGESAVRGDSVVIYGDLRRDVWEKDGNQRSKLKITANKVVVQEQTDEKGESDLSFS
jgi:single-strand DNA-binding protein